VVHALAVRLQPISSRTDETVLSVLCACYALELIVAMAAVLLLRSKNGSTGVLGSPRMRQELRRVLATLEGVLETIATAVVRGRVGRQSLEDIRQAEGNLHGFLSRGALDGVLMFAALQLALDDAAREGAVDQKSVAYRTVRSLVLVDDPQMVLGMVGPRGLLRLLDILHNTWPALEPSVVALRFALALLAAVQAYTAIPGDVQSSLHPASAARVSLELILNIFSTLGHRVAEADHTVFQQRNTVQLTVQFLITAPRSPLDDMWWRALTVGMQLLSSLVLHHRALAHDFEQRLLSSDLVYDESDCSQTSIAIDALLIISQLSRLSKDYYPKLHQMNVCGDLAGLLQCCSASVRAKACNAVGNLARHSDYFYSAIQQAGILQHLIPLCGDSDSGCRKFASFAVGNSAFHSDVLYPELTLAVPQLVRLLEDPDEKTRANAAGAIGNLVRNSSELCVVMLNEGAVQGLHNLVENRRPKDNDVALLDRFLDDSSVKIALFSLGNLAVHGECRSQLRMLIKATDLCRTLLSLCQRDDMIYKYAQRLVQKLG